MDMRLFLLHCEVHYKNLWTGQLQVWTLHLSYDRQNVWFPGLGPFCVDFAWSHLQYTGFPASSHSPNTCALGWSASVHRFECEIICLYVSSCLMGWRHVQVYHALTPCQLQQAPQSCMEKRYRQWMNEWISDECENLQIVSADTWSHSFYNKTSLDLMWIYYNVKYIIHRVLSFCGMTVTYCRGDSTIHRGNGSTTASWEMSHKEQDS